MIERFPEQKKHLYSKTGHKPLTNKTRMKYTDRQLNKQAEIMTIRQTNEPIRRLTGPPIRVTKLVFKYGRLG